MAYDHQTSLPAYKENPDGKDYCRQVVLLTVRKLGMCNDRQISEHLGWPINRITPRRGELVEAGLIIRVKRDLDPVTKRTVNWWMECKQWTQLPLF